jgi:mannose-1-phosphate guanylyltransferase
MEKRPWGGFKVLEDTPAFKVKRIWVHPGQRLSYQKHFHRSEDWVVVEGNGKVTLSSPDQKIGGKL